MAFADVRSELTCPVCWEIYTDPVTLPCGHNFCLRCIERTWDSQLGIEEDPSCPECRHSYRRRPELNRNRRLQSITEQLFSTRPEQVGAGIFCTYCDSPVPAAKSCLHCEASLCAHHLLMHSKSDKHILIDPMKPERGKCFMHGRNLEFNCTEDGARICASCWLAGEHRGHKVELLSETERRVQSLKKRRREVAEKVAGETERVTGLFRYIREQLEALEKRLLSDISRHNENISFTLCDPVQQLEVWKKPFWEMYPMKESYNMAQSYWTESEGQNEPDLWSLVSKTLLTGLEEIVAGVKVKIHGHQVRPHVAGKNFPEHSLKAAEFPSVLVKAAKRSFQKDSGTSLLWRRRHSEWPVKRTAPSDQETEGKTSASATGIFTAAYNSFIPVITGSQLSDSFPGKTTKTEVPLQVQPQIHVPGEKVPERYHQAGGFPSFSLNELTMEDLRISKSLQDKEKTMMEKRQNSRRRREKLQSLFSKMNAPSDHKTEVQKNTSPTVENIKIKNAGCITPTANILEGATEKWPWGLRFAEEETTKMWVPLQVQPQIHVPGEKVHEHSHRAGGFPSFSLKELTMEDFRTKSLQDKEKTVKEKRQKRWRQRERPQSLFSKTKEPSDHKTEVHTNTSPTVDHVRIPPSISRCSTLPANSLEGATENWPWSLSFAEEEEATKMEDIFLNSDSFCFGRVNSFGMDLSSSSSTSSSSSFIQIFS